MTKRWGNVTKLPWSHSASMVTFFFCLVTKLFTETGVDLCLDLWLSVLAFKIRQEDTPMMTDQQKQEIESLRKEGFSRFTIKTTSHAYNTCSLYHNNLEKKSIDLMEETGMDMYFAQFNMDIGCVDGWLTDMINRISKGIMHISY